MIRYKPIQSKQWISIKLEENLRFSDLMKNAGVSNLTKKFSKETNELMGNAPNHTKLIKMRINKVKDYVTFYWRTERTPKYKDNFHTQEVDPNTMTLKKSKIYEIEIRVLDFFKLLETTPTYPKIFNKDIEDVLMTADILIWDSTPSFQFQGGNYNLTILDGAIYPEHRSPKRWDRYHGKSNLFLSKHSQSLINNIKWYYPQMRQMVVSYLMKN